MDCRETLGWLTSEEDPPKKFDANLFVATVHAMFNLASSTRTGFVWPVRAMLRYLLLRRDPTTNHFIKLDHPADLRDAAPETYNVIRNCSCSALECKLDGKQTSVYPVLLMIQEMAHNVNRRWVIEEEWALHPLSLWVFTEDLHTELIETKRACMRLWKLHKANAIGSLNDEFLHDKLDYSRVYAQHLEFLAGTKIKTGQLVSEMNYLCLFGSLLRAVRMGIYDEVKGDLASELAWLRTETMSI